MTTEKNTSFENLIIIAGPTAIGKTAMAIALAKRFQCPVISADSRQFFKELSIGTAKPNEHEMDGVTHYFIDSHSILEPYNVGKYETDVIALLDELFRTHKNVIMVGGSGLYIDAVCKGFDELPDANEETRKQINELFATEGVTGLQELLKKLDIDYYHQVDLQNPQRMSRAIEVCITAGIPYSTLRKGNTAKRNFKSIKIGLNTSRELLYNRINQRVDDMIQQGLLNEVTSVYAHRHQNALQTVGYKELFDYLDGKTDLATAITLIKQNTRKFAKRQLTWFRRYADIKWFEPNELEHVIEYLQQVI